MEQHFLSAVGNRKDFCRRAGVSSVAVTLQAEDKKRKESGCNSIVLGCIFSLDILNLNRYCPCRF